MRDLSFFVSLLVLGLVPSLLRAEEEPKVTLQRAIKAAGGEEKLSRLRQARAKVKGSILVGEPPIHFTGSVVLSLPGRMRTEWVMDGGTQSAWVLDGETGWVRTDKTRTLDGSRLDDLKEEVYASNVETLLPLLNDKGYTLTPLGESKVEGETVIGVHVTSKGHKDIDLYFGRAAGLLLKLTRSVNEGNREVRQETFYSDFRDVGGPKQPLKVRVERDGKKYLEMEITDVRLLDRLDASEFAKP